jgi:ketosteroid isomerase-like protein
VTGDVATGTNADRIRGLYARWNEEGRDAFVASLSEAIAWRGIDTDGMQRTFHGRAEVAAMLERLASAFGAARIEPEEYVEVGERVVVPIRLFPVDAPPGDAADPLVQLDLTEAWTLRGGEIVEYRAYLSRQSALESARRHAAKTD